MSSDKVGTIFIWALMIGSLLLGVVFVGRAIQQEGGAYRETEFGDIVWHDERAMKGREWAGAFAFLALGGCLCYGLWKPGADKRESDRWRKVDEAKRASRRASMSEEERLAEDQKLHEQVMQMYDDLE